MHSASGLQSGLSGGRDILVEGEDLDRPREVLKADEGGFDEEELTRLSEEAGRDAIEHSPSPQPIQTDDQSEFRTPRGTHAPAKTHNLRRSLEALAKDEHGANAPGNPFGR